jgi:hypothetical protein
LTKDLADRRSGRGLTDVGQWRAEVGVTHGR